MFANKTHEEADKKLKDGKIEESLKLFNKALDLSPNDPDIISDRGVAYLHLNDETNCFKDFNRALELEPKKAYRYAARAYAKKHFKDLNGAVEDYIIAVDLDPEDAIAQNNLGLLLEEQGYQTAATERFKRADSLSKIEDGLLDAIDEIEGVQPEIELIPVEEKKENTKNVKTELKKVVTSKKQFKEFVRFVKNGFKLK